MLEILKLEKNLGGGNLQELPHSKFMDILPLSHMIYATPLLIGEGVDPTTTTKTENIRTVESAS